MPLDEASIRQRLKALSQEITSHHADLLELLVRFDDLEAWKTSGARHCAAWMNLEIGIGIQSGWEYLRVGRKLRTLPTLQALFRAGKLSWSKVRLISRVAEANNERTLCHAALDASVSGVKRLCAGYRWQEDSNAEAESYRFRVVDAQGQDIRNRSDADTREGGAWPTFDLADYTRVYCGEPVLDYGYGGVRYRHAPPSTSEAPAHYATSA